MQHRQGAYRWVRSRGLAVRDGNGKATRMAGSQTDITAEKATDPLTGLPNRFLFVDQLERAIQSRRRRPKYLFAVLFLGLDRFTDVNDSFGPLIGDQLLIAVAHRLQACVRSTDSVTRYEPGHAVARLGGDEFGILLDDISHVSDAIRVAERLQKELARPFMLYGQDVFTSMSIGIAVSATGYERPEECLRDANTAMHQAKTLGIRGYELFDPAMRDAAFSRMQLEIDLRKAVTREEFHLFYQPIVSLERGCICGFEALVRWQHPQRGLVSPDEFIPVAEETRLILPVGRLVLHQACQQMKTWQARFGTRAPTMMSVNLSSKQLQQSDLVEQIQTILRQTGLEPGALKLEITESSFMEDLGEAIATLLRLKSLGLRVAIDDFGTGYSSLSYLYRLPIDTLKIDRSFVSRIEVDSANSGIVGTIVSLAHSLKLDVIAEGVETAAQLVQLQALGCEHVQGYYFSKPITADAASALIETWPSGVMWQGE
jgi:diguanylate cyclase (GGDEF)-like protein